MSISINLVTKQLSLVLYCALKLAPKMPYKRPVTAFVGLFLLLGSTRAQDQCRNIPGDEGWPSRDQWSQLNETVGGRLIETVPISHVCHTAPFNAYNEAECNTLQEEWGGPQPLYVALLHQL